MKKDLIVLTDEECRRANEVLHDPFGWTFAQSEANRDVRQEMQNVAFALEIAQRNPEDEDCRRLINAVNAVVREG